MTGARRLDSRVHAIVDDVDAAGRAVRMGATVIQLRIKNMPTDEVIRRGRPFLLLGAAFVVNDDVDAAITLGADGVHLGLDDSGAERAVAAGLDVGISASTPLEARTAEQLGASYIGCGPIWPTPTKPDAGPPVGLDGLRVLCASTRIPVIAIGGVDARNAGACIAAGAAGVAVVRAATATREVRQAVNRALEIRASLR